MNRAGLALYLAAWLATCSWSYAARAADVSPIHPGTKLKDVGLFDGPPAEMGELAPDIAGATTGHTVVAQIYAEHQRAYAVCGYRDGTSQTVAIRTPVRQCDYTLEQANLFSSFTCH